MNSKFKFVGESNIVVTGNVLNVETNETYNAQLKFKSDEGDIHIKPENENKAEFKLSLLEQEDGSLWSMVVYDKVDL